jgi:hypothetical protein
MKVRRYYRWEGMPHKRPVVFDGWQVVKVVDAGTCVIKFLGVRKAQTIRRGTHGKWLSGRACEHFRLMPGR